MKKIVSWGLYFLVCAVVIIAAIAAGRQHDHCHECETAFGKKENRKEIVHWEKFIRQAERK